MVFFAVCMILGIVFSTYLVSNRLDKITAYFGMGLIFFFLIIAIILIFIFRSELEIKTVAKRVILCLLAFIVGFGSLFMSNLSVNKSKIQDNKYTITARVCDIPNFYNNQDLMSVVLDDVVIVDKNNSYNLDHKIKCYVSGDYIVDDLLVGNIIKLSAKVSHLTMSNEREIDRKYNYLANDIYYTANAISNVEVLDEFRVNVFENFKLKAKDLLDTTLSENYSSIAYGMLFGEDEFIKDKISDVYQNAGISHLLAVSGLHVGFVILLLSIIFSLCHIDDRLSSIILILVLFLYVIVCDFTSSVVRAFIMTSCMLMAKVFGKPYDGLSSLGCACIIILLFSPLSIFTVGFQLSFMAVLGILLLNPILSRVFSKFLFEQFASSLSLSLSASIGIMPIMAINFNKISILSVFTNMIVIPIASIAFMLLFITVIVSMIIPSISVIIVPFEYIMRFVTAVASIAANISINTFSINVGTGILFFVIGVCAIVSEYIKINKFYKIGIILYLCKIVYVSYIVRFALILLL